MEALTTPLISAALAFALTSCVGGKYARGFDQTVATMPSPAPSADGPWKGTWKSDVNGHTGPLWCIVQPTPDRPGFYDFRYRAGWGLIKFGDYTHTVPAKPAADGSLQLSGEMLLPGGFGNYRVEGKLTRDAFDATYKSAADHGTMTLRRPEKRE